MSTFWVIVLILLAIAGLILYFVEKHEVEQFERRQTERRRRARLLRDEDKRVERERSRIRFEAIAQERNRQRMLSDALWVMDQVDEEYRRRGQ